MFVPLLISNIVALISASEQEPATFINAGVDNRNIRGLSNVRGSSSNTLRVIYNTTYVDKEDNLLRMPTNYNDDHKNKKKIKKNPKRTVQKIIKKKQYKNKKLYMFPPTSNPTIASKPEQDEDYTRKDLTTEGNFKKKSRKNTKYLRYSMPFHAMQRKDGVRNRYRREDRDVYILQDFDEIKFLSSEKDHNKVVAHVKKYW